MTKDIELLPCPFCGGPARTFQYNGTTQAQCAKPYEQCAGTDVASPVVMWNRRSTDMESERPAPAAQVGGVVEAARAVLAAKFATFKARNGRDVGVEDDNGEKCWIVPFDEIFALEAALSAIPTETGKGEDGGEVDVDTRRSYHEQIGKLLKLVSQDRLDEAQRAEFDAIDEEHSWDGLSCACGGGWLVGHRDGCPEATPPCPSIEEGEPDGIWPARLTLRDTKVIADEGQRIFTTATGYGYEKREYVRSDIARPVPAVTDEAVDDMAALLWRTEATDAGVPQSVIDGRTRSAFDDEGDSTKNRWRKFARAVLSLSSKEA